MISNLYEILSYGLTAISLEPMTDPVICADGHSYERAHIEAWLLDSNISPKTGAPLPHRMLVPNHSLRSAIEHFVAK